jgi:excisionase family DNA binding protein
LLTVKEVAAYLRVGRVTVWRWCKEGTIPACRVGRNWRIPRDDFFDVLEGSHSPELDLALSTALDNNHKGQTFSPSADDEEPPETVCGEEAAGLEERQV